MKLAGKNQENDIRNGSLSLSPSVSHHPVIPKARSLVGLFTKTREPTG